MKTETMQQTFFNLTAKEKGEIKMKLVDDNGKILYDAVVAKYPWIIKRDQLAILSPDSDGLLCGLLMQYLLGWKVAGFYDGKVMALKDGLKASDCVFLDMEIFRSFTRSMGQHMLMWNHRKDILRPEWAQFDNCISPNNMRLFDGNPTGKKFPRKYPLGTIHLLLGIVGSQTRIEIRDEAICPLLYTDGTFKNMFNYPENVLDWLSFLCAENDQSPLYKVFFNNSYTTNKLMLALRDFFAKIKEISGSSRGGDKIVISSSQDKRPVNFVQRGDLFDLNLEQRQIANKFLKMLSELTGWKYDDDSWSFDGLRLSQFNKNQIKPNGRNYDAMISQNPISWAMTSSLAIEYTTEGNTKLN